MGGQTNGSQGAIMVMAQVSKEDCMSIDEAAKNLGFSRATVYSYLNVLNLQRYRFPYDRRTYILKTDIERIRKFVQENRG